MQVMTETDSKNISAGRLRLGVVFIILFWLPIWLLTPVIYGLFGVDSPEARHQIVLGILIIQTICGILGALIVGRQVMQLVHQVPKRKVLPIMWRVLIHGQLDSSQ